MEEAKRLLDSAETVYANKLFDIKAKKEFEIVERLCTYMFSVANLYHEGYQSLSKLEPSIRKLMADLVNAQNEYLHGKNPKSSDIDNVCSFPFPIYRLQLKLIDIPVRSWQPNDQK